MTKQQSLLFAFFLIRTDRPEFSTSGNDQGSLYKKLSKNSGMFPDGIHPDAAGAKVMAE